MIEICTEENGYLNLRPDAKITIEQNNDLFNFDLSLNGGFSLPFSLPNTKNNREILSNSQRLDIFDDMPEPIMVLVKIDGNTLFKGLLTVTSAGTNGFEVDILVGKSAISNITGKRLKDLALGIIAMTGEVATQDDIMTHLYDVAVSPDDYPYVFPVIKNPNAWDDRDTELNMFDPTNVDGILTTKRYQGYINFYEAGYIKNQLDASGTPTILNINSYIPFLKLNYILGKIFDIAGVDLVGSILTDELIKACYIYNTHNIDKTDTPIPVVVGITYQAYITICKSFIECVNHVPDMLATDFIKAVAVMFNLNFNYTQALDKVSVDCRQDLLDLEPDADWTNKLQPSYKKSQDKQQTWYSLSMTADADDAFIDETKALVYKYLEASNRQEIITDASYPLMEDDTITGLYYATRQWFIPSVQQRCNCTEANLLLPTNPYSLRLLIYRGLQQDVAGDNFPYASYTDHLADSVTPYFANSLKWEGETGLYANRYERWFEFVAKPVVVEAEVILTHTELLNLDLSRKKRIGNQNYFIKTISTSITNQTANMLRAKVTLVKTT